MKEGPLFFGLQALQSASNDRNVPASIEVQLDKALADLAEELKLSQEGLRNVHEDSLRGKLVYAIWRGNGSHHQLVKLSASLKASCDRLKDFCLQLHGFRSGKPSYLWTRDTFKLRHETLDNRPGEHLPISDIIVAAGNYVENGGRIEGNFILESKGRENDVRYLCSVLNATALARREGILPVLGYRQPPYNEPDGSKVFQLLAQLPRDTPMNSLAYRISSEPGPDQLARLQFCRSIARALASVHSLGLLHKSVRPRAILTPSDPVGRNEDPLVYLQDWSYIREMSGATTQLGENSWQKALYQHPERQGRYAEVAYQPRHDIYSLGVNMLEILLWTPFVVSELQTASHEPTRVCDIFETTGLRLGESNGGLPARYRGDPVRLTSRPQATRAIWREVAASELDTHLQNLVLGCINETFDDVSEVLEALNRLI